MKIKVTKNMVGLFADLTGDHNLIHVDNEYAKNTIFKECIAHGTFISGFIGTKIAQTFKDPILKNLNMKFTSPIYVDSFVEIFFENIKKDKNTVSFEIVVKTSKNENELDGKVAIIGDSQIVLKR